MPATLTATGEGQLAVAGPMVFATAADLLVASRKLLTGGAPITIDLGSVTDADSAGLAVLLEWLRWARAEGRPSRFTRLPDKLLAIARLSGVDGLVQQGYSPSSSSKSSG